MGEITGPGIGGGGGGGQVNSIVGTTNEIDVDATDPANPVVSLDAVVLAELALAGSSVQSVSGTLNEIDSTGGSNPVLSLAAPVLADLALAASAAQPGDNVSIFANDVPYLTAASLPVGANPTATVGTAVVNGVAGTFMRSDAAPPLSAAVQTLLNGAIQASVLTTNGDLLTRAGGVPARIGIGANTNVLTVVAGAPAWAAAPAGASGANPAGTVGLAAVNGVATTFLRSDGAPPLSQAIAPTWTAQHIWTGSAALVLMTDGKELRFGTGGDDLAIYHDGTNNFIDSNTGDLNLTISDGSGIRLSTSGTLEVQGTSPNLSINQTDGGTDEKIWRFLYAGTTLTLATRTDANGAGNNAITFTRTGTTINLMNVSPALRINALDTNAANVVRSGTYTPTLTAVANVAASTAHVCRFMRVGNVVQVSGIVEIDPTTTGLLTTLGMSLPIASNFASSEELSGLNDSQFNIIGDTTNDRATFTVASVLGAANITIRFQFNYEII